MKSTISCYLFSLLCLLINSCQCNNRKDYIHVDMEEEHLVKPVLFEASVCSFDLNWDLKPFEAMRVQFFPGDMSNFSKGDQIIFDKIFRDTAEFFGKVFMVRRSAANLSMPGGDACKHSILWKYAHHMRADVCSLEATDGIDADFVTYYGQISCERGQLASAGACGYSFDKRPTFGRVNLCLNNLKTANWNKESLAVTLRHELMHAMGLTRGFFWNLEFKENGVTIKGATKEFVRIWKINKFEKRLNNVKLVVTPKVKTFVREHFNCSDLEGAEVENEGGGGTEGSHWEKRLFGPETMTGYISRASYLSRLTLAYFEDTSWYMTNYSQAHDLVYGKGRGCNFAKLSCREYIDSVPDVPEAADPYCNWADLLLQRTSRSEFRKCSLDLKYFVHCDWLEAGIPNRSFTYFYDKWAIVKGKNITGERWYGEAPTGDGCPIWNEYDWDDWREHKIGDSVCENEFSQPQAIGNWGVELYGKNSICLRQDGKFEVFQCYPGGINIYDVEKAHGAGCYKYKCYRGRLAIQANYSIEGDPKYDFQRQYKICWGQGSIIQIRRHQKSGPGGKWRYHKGVIVCPDCKRLCENNQDYPGFKCAKDIHLNSTDFATLECRQTGGGKRNCLNIFEIFTLILFLVF